MTGSDLVALLPLLLTGLTAVAVMLSIAIRRRHGFAVGVAACGLAAAFASLWVAAGDAPRHVTPLIVIDPFGLFYIGLILAATLAVVILSHGYFARQAEPPEELYVLLPTAALGAATIVVSSHFVSFFLGLEVLSVALYGLIAYLPARQQSVEAGFKYLVLAASSAAVMLFGFALIYARLGTMEFGRMTALLTNRANFYDPVLLAGLVLALTGLGFKLAVVPFHMWTPDVYEGAPAPVAAFIATVSKGAVLGLLVRYFRESPAAGGPVFLVFTIIAIASMFAGNLLALLQRNVKRILGYSSIAHLGYILVAFQAGGMFGAEAVTFYLVAYFVTMLGAFGVVAALSDGTRDADRLEDYRGLFWRRPVLAGVFTAMLLSLAGIPLTAGFLGKFYVVMAGASSAIWSLLIVLVVTSAIGLFYYLRIVVALYATDDEPAPAPERARPAPLPMPTGSGAVLAVLTVLLIWLGVYPAVLLGALKTIFVGLI